MTKKRIADLLKEEVEKPVGEATTEPKREKDSKDGDAESKGRTRKRPSAAKSATTQSTPRSTAKAATKAIKKTAGQPSDDLTQKVAELEAALTQSAEQIMGLQADVNSHQDRIFELKDKLEKAESDRTKKAASIDKLVAELKEAKQTIVSLTAAKAADSRETAPTAEKAAPPEPAPKPAERQSLSLQRRPYSSYKSIPEYAIQRGTPTGGQNNSMLDDDDIGWVD
ncbi:MAG: hypothetical protein WA885_19345 [Phormidesmis sp.]